MAVTIVERYRTSNPCARGALALLPTVLLLGGIVMLVLGALCVSSSSPNYGYCSTISYGGALALLIIGAIIVAAAIVQYVVFSRTVWVAA